MQRLPFLYLDLIPQASTGGWTVARTSGSPRFDNFISQLFASLVEPPLILIEHVLDPLTCGVPEVPEDVSPGESPLQDT